MREDVIGEEHDGCDIGVLETGLIALDNDTLPFSAGDSIGELTNPLMFSGEAWPVS